MRLLELRNRINELMSIFVTQIRGAGAMGQTDINNVSETVLIPLFAEIYGYKKLRNLNTTERANYPAIDLADDEAGVAFQITSRADLEKIKDTLKKFADHELYKKYDRLVIYVLTQKQQTYSKAPCESIVRRRFDFDVDKDIEDYRDILQRLEDFQIDKTSRIRDILEANFGEGKTHQSFHSEEQFTENVHLNLLELSFPSDLYLSDITVDEKSVPRTSRKDFRGRRGRRLARELVQDALEQRGLKFGVDWECHQNQILTFHDLSDSDNPLAQIVDQGTVTPLDPDEFYGVDKNRERVFKTLLGRCLQQKLYHQGVKWQYQDKQYVFASENGSEIRTERWFGKQWSEREVYKRVMKKNKPHEISYCKHLAFRTQYKRFGKKWFLLMKPEWFFSYDGYRRSPFGSERIEWLKRQEKNAQVFNHLRFIVYFLKHERPSDFFSERHAYPFLSFGELLSFDSALALDDNEWNPPQVKEETVSGQLEMFDL